MFPSWYGFEDDELAWKIANRLPYAVKNRLAFALGGRGWYPAETDWRFTTEDYDGAHALLAVAR